LKRSSGAHKIFKSFLKNSFYLYLSFALFYYIMADIKSTFSTNSGDPSANGEAGSSSSASPDPATSESGSGNGSAEDTGDDMGGLRNRATMHWLSSTCFRMNRCKTLAENLMETPLRRCLSTLDITLLGIGHMVGAGIYVLTGTVANSLAGPAIVVSFIIAGFASILAALCYAEFGSRVPKAGSAYVYTYVTIGEFWAFVIGWNILLEHMLGAASVSRAWSGYVDALTGGVIANGTRAAFGDPQDNIISPDFLAFGVCLVYCTFTVVGGVKGNAYFNSFFTMINIAVILFVTIYGFYFADSRNWTDYGGFAPFGFSGILAGAATCFYAYVGFDSIATAGEEARNPTFSIPVATFISMSVVTVGYICVSAALTLMIPYTTINPAAALADAFGDHGVNWAKIVISVGAIAGMTTTLFGSLFALPRGVYAMAQDGLLFKVFGRVHDKTQLPLITIGVWGFLSAVVALVFDIEKLVEFMSIGTLMAYTIVSAAVIILRYREVVRVDTLPLADAPEPVNETMYETGRLQPRFLWLENIIGEYPPGKVPSTCVLVFTVSSIIFLGILKWGGPAVHAPTWWAVLFLSIFVIIGLTSLLLVCAHQQSNEGLRFKVPWVPLIPAISILANVALMVNLNPMTWVRFLVWMVIGLAIYFGYGIRNSRENAVASSFSGLLTNSETKGVLSSPSSSQMDN
jgi:cationic amino acid transporter 4